jgi:hypothetical protein
MIHPMERTHLHRAQNLVVTVVTVVTMTTNCGRG